MVLQIVTTQSSKLRSSLNTSPFHMFPGKSLTNACSQYADAKLGCPELRYEGVGLM